MTATNINIQEFVNVLQALTVDGSQFIDLDMVSDPDHPNMNKLIIHAVPAGGRSSPNKEKEKVQEIQTRNPNINPDTNEIFNSFNL